MKNCYFSLMNFIGLLEKSICYGGILLCSVLVFIQVLNRYLLHFEIMWIGDLTLYLYVMFMLLCIALTAREDGHTTVDVFVDMFFKNRPKELLIYRVVTNCTVLAILVWLFPLGLKMFKSALKYPEYGTLVNWFNTSWHRELLFIVLILCIIHTIHNIVLQIIRLVKRDYPSSIA